MAIHQFNIIEEVEIELRAIKGRAPASAGT